MIPRSEKYREIDRRYLWHPYSGYSAIQEDDFPVIVRGRGPWLYDADGKKYFDAISSWWCCNLGHGHPRLVRAIKGQAAKLQHSILGNMSHPPAIELAEELGKLFVGKKRVFFSSDGASAVEAAIKIAFQFWHNTGQPRRNRLVSLENAYHGDTLGAVSAGYLPRFHAPFKPLLFPVLRAKSPDCPGCPHKHADGRCNCECFASMEGIIEKRHEQIAAVIFEPLCQCAAGMRMYPPLYLSKLARLCRAHRILMIADEIAVGFGRTGEMFAFEHSGIDPDIVCLGKSLAGGYLPISATIVREGIFNSFRDTNHTFYHGHTFAGNPIAATAALEVLKIFKEERIVESARRKGELMRKEMDRLQSSPGVKNTRFLGMIAALELAGEKVGAARAQEIKKRMTHKGVLIRPLGNVIYLMPPLVTPDDILKRTIDLLANTLVITPG